MLGIKLATKSAEAPPLQRMKSIMTILSIISFGVVAFVMLFNIADPLWHALLLLPGLVAALWVVGHWHTALPPRVLVPILILGQMTWILAVLLGIHPLGMFGLAITGAIAITTYDVNRTVASTLLLALVTGTGLLTLLVNPDGLGLYTMTPAAYTIGIIAVFWVNELSWRLFTDLDEMRRNEAELAVMRERFRFASDLHDIQGHTLHVIKLKAAVAAKLQHSDPERTAAELAEIQRLTAETIEQARELANSTHKLSFTSELANARNLLEAAGIRVQTDRATPEAVSNDAIFALVLREATTNILRHSQARIVSINVNRNQLSVNNDGAIGPGEAPRGLDALRMRVSDAGGALEFSRSDDSFALTLRFDE